MNKIAWATDIHLNFVTLEKCQEFCKGINNLGVDALLLGGDIGDAPSVEFYLHYLADHIQVPIYFVLGNHDYYKGSIADIRSSIANLCNETSKLTWLTQSAVVRLSEDTCLVGHDGWSDGRIGDFDKSQVMLNDYKLIRELRGLTKGKRLDRLHALGDEAAEHFRQVLPHALEDLKHVIVLTHVPPFRDACWHEGEISSPDYLPHFSCKAVGDVLRELMAGKTTKMTVLCGHTHSNGNVLILPNLLVKTGKAVYGRPGVNEVISLV
ncbi:metallophosphoesterase family protein [Citrifermentans bremense]|uniref:metallophosphoesterase family protein n=1 Tax=Citrifermentans bremense TaxID=60035 RepID=UPI00047C0613|nr:metallophosphoesterase [Citrifermentans bremense]